jgi:hypothetical protein
MCSAKSHHSTKKKHCFIMKLLYQLGLSVISGIQNSQSYSPECNITLQTSSSDIAGIQDTQSYSPEHTITSQKEKVRTMNEFLDAHQLPTNLKEVECQSYCLHLLNPITVKSELFDSLSCTNRFWKLPDFSTQLTRFIDSWAYDRKSILNTRLALLIVY